jgi:PAS domain S-box-containing protein
LENSVLSSNIRSDTKADEASRLAYRFRQASQLIALLVGLLGLLVLGGGAFNLPTLTYIRPEFESMKANTALSFVLLSAGLWLAHDDKRRRSRRILGLAVVIIAGATLAEYAFHISLGIDQLLFLDPRTPSLAAYPGRMAIATVTCLLLLSMAVVCLGLRKAIVLQRALVAASFALSLVALCGYLYGVKSLYSITSFSTMSPQTAAAVFAASLAYFLARPDEGVVSIAASNSNSGILLRTLVPAIIAVPILIGWLRMAGQRAHLYDTPFGIALQVLGSVGCLTALTFLIVRSMHRLECEHARAEQAVRESNEWLRLAVQAGKMYAYEWDITSDVLVRSPECVNVLGATEPRTLTFQQVIEKIHPDDRPKLAAAVARHSPKTPTVDVAYRVLLPGKPPIWVKSSGRGLFDGDGKLLRVVGIVADITDQKLTEEALRASEERLRLAQKVARIGTFERNIRTGVNTWTAEMESMYGLPPGGFGQTRAAFENLVHPDDRAEVIKLVEEALKTRQPTSGEWRVIWPDGSVHWIAGRWQVLMDESGEPSRVVGVDMDITERKLAEEALSNMTRNLVEAQEQERARIARELHDDVNQRLALLTIELEQLRDEPSRVRRGLQELKERITSISTDIHAVAHDLHSSKLEYLGVAAGMKSWCREFAERRKLEVDCRHGVRSALPNEIGLCLFRVLQQALDNAAKHSGVSRIEVQLQEECGEVHLIVSDSGRGFDVEAVKQGKGLGLTSMRERVRLVNGTIAIDSKPRSGTTIHVRVPLSLEQDSQRAAG